MSNHTDDDVADKRQAVGLWRLAVLGPLISARLEHGDRRALFEKAAARTHQHPDGRWVRVSARTIESWFYTYHRAGGFRALIPDARSDRGRSRAIHPELAELVLAVKREKPRRSIRQLIRLLERAGKVRRGVLSRSSVHRLLVAHGLSARPPRDDDTGGGTERRSFLPEHAGDLWMGDALHGPLVIAPDGRIRKSYLLSQIDAATRFLPHSYFALSEDAAAHEYGFKQAILKHGPPATYYVDRGAAYWATSLRLICAEIGTHLHHTRPRDCEAKGGVERWHRTWRDEVGDELPKDPVPLAELNAKHWAWLATEYHRRKHDTTGQQPLVHWLAEAPYLRTLPAGKNMDEVFLHRGRRRVRKDGTVRFRGMLLEVRPELVGRIVELRFEPSVAPDSVLPRVFVDNRFACDTVLLDRFKNCSRRRHHRKPGSGTNPSPPPPTGLDPLALMEAEHYRRLDPDPHPAPTPARRGKSGDGQRLRKPRDEQSDKPNNDEHDKE